MIVLVAVDFFVAASIAVGKLKTVSILVGLPIGQTIFLKAKLPAVRLELPVEIWCLFLRKVLVERFLVNRSTSVVACVELFVALMVDVSLLGDFLHSGVTIIIALDSLRDILAIDFAAVPT